MLVVRMQRSPVVGSALRRSQARLCATSTSSTPAASSDSGGSSSGSSSKSEGDSSGSRLHSSDIAFKPNDDGWGYTKSYAKSWDRIFGKKQADTATAAPAAEATVTPPPVNTPTVEQISALEAARACGALSEELFEQAKQELSKAP